MISKQNPVLSNLAGNMCTKLPCPKFPKIKIQVSKIYLSNFSANGSQVSGRGGFGKSSASSGLLLPNEKRLFIHLCLRKITSKENKMKHILIQVRAVLLNHFPLTQKIFTSKIIGSSPKLRAIDKCLVCFTDLLKC